MSAARDDFVSFVEQILAFEKRDCKFLIVTEAAFADFWFVGWMVTIL